MSDNVFLACFVGCLLALVAVVILVWQVGGWLLVRWFRSMGILKTSEDGAVSFDATSSTKQEHDFDVVARVLKHAEPVVLQGILDLAQHEIGQRAKRGNATEGTPRS